MPDGVSGVTSTAVMTDTPVTTTRGLNEMDGQMFLKLLIAQLRYQDPLNPAKGTEFMAQTAQFTLVEKMTELLASQRQASAGNLIGRWVVATDADGMEVSGVVTRVRMDPGGPILTVGDTEVALSAVKEVRQQDSQ